MRTFLGKPGHVTPGLALAPLHGTKRTCMCAPRITWREERDPFLAFGSSASLCSGLEQNMVRGD